MTLDPLGNIVLDSQGDQELIIVSDPDSPKQRVLRLPLSYLTSSGPMSVETDDTAFITSTEGFLLFADKGLNAVYTLQPKRLLAGHGVHGCGRRAFCRHSRLYHRSGYARCNRPFRSGGHDVCGHLETQS